MKNFLQLFYQWHIDFVNCIFCGAKMSGAVCSACSKGFKVRIPPYCQICGERLVSEFSLCSKCKQRQEENKGFVHDHCPMYSLFTYNQYSKYLMQHYKIDGYRILGFYIAQCYHQLIVKYIPQNYTICIIPMPSNVLHTKEKGFDHMRTVLYFLKLIHRYTVIGCVARRISKEQKKLNVKDRKKNMQQSLYCKIPRIWNWGKTEQLANSRAPDSDVVHSAGDGLNLEKARQSNNFFTELEKYDRIILLDDIITTGSTLQVARALLIEQNSNIANKILGMSLIRTEY